MFLRKLRVHKDGKEHGYWSLVETVRTADGPRQRTLCYLGELNGSAHARWQKTVEVFNEQGETTQLKLFPSAVETPDDPNIARVLVKKVRVERTRRFGDCYLGLELWQQLGLAEFLARHLDVDHADVPWSRIAAVLAINRLCDPGSELAPQVADLYEMAMKDSKEGPRLVWQQKPEQQQWLEAREGAYLLRTNLTVDGAADLWKKYMQLTEVEAAFRTLKSELAIRPLFHQLEKRVKAHVLVAFLGYALQVTLKHLLKRSASEYSPAEALKWLAEIRSVDIVLPTVEGREIWLRRITKLDEQQQRILHQLRLQLPERLEPIQIQKCSADSAIA